MPNYVQNRLEVSRSYLEPYLVYRKSHYSEKEEQALDFDLIIPQPELIKKYNRVYSDIRRAAQGAVSTGKEPEKSWLEELTTERREQYEDLVTCLKKYGYADWYSWRLEHWGTKWNACESIVTDEYTEFQTAWNAPHRVIKTFAHRHKLSFIHCWADEDTGFNVGYREFKEGKLIIDEEYSDTRKGHELAFELWGLGEDWRWDESQGRYVHIED